MAEISAKDVNELRRLTGLGLMKCKELLVKTGGDMPKAVTLAKEEGIKDAGKRAARAAKAGRIEVAFSPDSKTGAIIELNCETDFVARNDEFRQTAKALADHVLHEAGAGDVLDQKFRKDPSKTVRQTLIELNARTGENISVARTARFAGAGRVDAYVHHDGKSGALVEVAGPADPALVKDIAMQVVAAKPLCVGRGDVPADVVAEQKRIFLTQVADKPENVREKIATGKLDAWFRESVLLEQELVKDASKKVRDLLGSGLTVTRFARFVVGEAPDAEPAPAS